MNINEKKFYDALENIFTGAKIEGEGGYVNLLKIKSKYYKKVLEQFKKDVDNEPIITDSFKEEFFDKLYSFFEKYFSESGSVYFVKTANWQKVYEQVYTDNKDVVLFWKTHMLYYVKSDILFQSIDVEITDERAGISYNFYFDVGTLQNKKNNEKRELVFTFREIKEEDNKKVHIFDVAYSERGRKTKIDDIVKKTKITEEILEKAFRTFRKQTEVDFFINKNAKKFLEEQLDMYMHQILLAEENKFDQKRLDQLKTIQKFAKKIIAFISQFEDELVRIWNKPKFVLNSNYVITLDKLSDEMINKIANHPSLPEQIKEWIELGIVEEGFDFNKRDEEKHKYLPIDTKYFKDLELDILDLFDNLDEALDGRLIHSENYQALNTLLPKYKEKVQTIYIDPPFNTGSDFVYVDKFQDSTWLTLMYDRIELGRKFLRDDGSFYLHLDHNADYLGRLLMNSIFGNEYFQNKITWRRQIPRGKKVEAKFYSYSADFIYLYANKLKSIWNIIEIENELTLKEADKKYMKDEKGYFRTSDPGSYSNESLIKFFNEGRIYVTNGGKAFIDKDGILKTDKGKLAIKYYREIRDNKVIEKKVADNIWTDIAGMGVVSQEYINFSTQKPEKLLEKILLASSSENTLILDFFLGSATTTSVAHKLNRKWLGIEMGNHLYSVGLPRMKTVLFGKFSGISKELEKQGKLKKGGFFKYYHLEQYEDTLRNMKYKDNTPTDLFDTKKAFEQYIFFADEKFAHVLEVNGNNLDIDFDKLYPNIDFAETISNLLGLQIKKITKTSVILQDEDNEKEIKTDYKNMTNEEKLEFIRLLKPLLWWGE
jgi:adenine-specific DNA-methyltransferase